MDDKMFNDTCREDRRQTTYTCNSTCNTSQLFVVLREYLKTKLKMHNESAVRVHVQGKYYF